jgi:hypothetical protein
LALIQFYKIKKKILSISEAFHLFICKKIVEDICSESFKKIKLLSVFHITNRILEGY